MNFKKRLLSGAVAVALMATALPGCSGSAQGTSSGASSQAALSSASAGKTVEIEFWYGLGGKLGDTMKGMIDDFNASQSEVKVKGVAQGSYDETYQALQAAIASGTAPACFLTDSPGVHNLAEKNVLADVTPYINKNSDFNLDDMVPAFLAPAQIDNKLYGIPAYGTTQLFYYRKDLFEKAGVSADVLNSWEDLEKASAKLAQKSGDTTSVYAWEPMWGSDNMVDAVLSAGGSVLSEDGKTVTIDDQVWINTWEYFRRNIFDNKTMRIHSGGQGWEYWYSTIDDAMQGKAAGYTGSSGDQGDLDFSKMAAHEQPGWNGQQGKPSASSRFVAIPASVSDEQKAAAFQWMTYYSSAANTAKWSMASGYIPVRLSAQDDPTYKAYLEKNPQAAIPLQQASHASPVFLDPTDGKITDILSKACDKVEIENQPVAEVLKQAKIEAQKALDQALTKK
ncbi:MAG: ABC transporter substrate-binding protein [Oscillospiraceae bacterium]|jgi:multiple sugar transport system substrate-binding protein|nr:ABC transporter substrate-binding protein [Oscillospiraceae bacterium]